MTVLNSCFVMNDKTRTPRNDLRDDVTLGYAQPGHIFSDGIAIYALLIIAIIYLNHPNLKLFPFTPQCKLTEKCFVREK